MQHLKHIQETKEMKEGPIKQNHHQTVKKQT